jgi:ABC-type nitrate/sulfonate/bicarbonate transport system permease component
LARGGDRLYPLLTLALVFAVVEALSRFDILPRHGFPPLSQMLETLAEQVRSGSFWSLVGQTLKGVGYGLGLATVLAVPAGIAVGSAELAYRAVRGVVEFLRPIPSVALVPLAVLVWGTGFTSKLFLVVYAAFWPLFIQTLYGMRDVDPVMVDTARSYGLGRLARLRFVTLPSALPYVATGLRIASAVALILAVTAELVIGSPGLGAAITLANANGNVRLMYALIIATGLLGWAISIVFTQLERRVLRWHPSQRRSAR